MNSSALFRPVVRALATGAITLVALSASAQQIWKWKDANGQVHISDQPPPAGASILQKPTGTPMPAAAPAPAPTPAAAPAASGAGPKAGVDAELAKRKAAADKKRAEEDKAAVDAQKAQDAQNCASAREQLRTLNSGIRITRLNAAGEREVMDDNAKAEQAKQAQQVVDKTCH